MQCSFTYIYLQLQFAYSSSTISRRTAKTTLLNYILTQQHGKKIAVIENEYGEVGIDDALVQQKFDAEEEIFEMNNGCICCTVRFESILRVVLFTVVCIPTLYLSRTHSLAHPPQSSSLRTSSRLSRCIGCDAIVYAVYMCE